MAAGFTHATGIVPDAPDKESCTCRWKGTWLPFRVRVETIPASGMLLSIRNARDVRILKPRSRTTQKGEESVCSLEWNIFTAVFPYTGRSTSQCPLALVPL